jgi:integrase
MENKSIKETISKIKIFYNQEYKQSSKTTMNKICSEFLVYLEVNELKYSEIVAEDWLTIKMKENNGHYYQTMDYYHIVNTIIEAYRDDLIIFNKSYYLHLKRKEPVTYIWQQIINSYVNELKLESKAPSTISFRHITAVRFICYLEKQGCFNPDQLTVELCRDYEKYMAFLNPNTMVAYQTRIRLFIRHLIYKNMINKKFEYVITTKYRKPQKVITIITKEQKMEFQSNQKTDDDTLNRSYAMGTLALYLGLRSIDIIDLEFSNISWKANTISIIQHKTKRHLKLPLIPVVGNAIADYIFNHRPKTNSKNIFVSHRKPYQRLQQSSACYGASTKLISTTEPNQPKGFHILRRTFCADLLKSEVNLTTASNFLGHSSLLSINPYLSLDGNRMKACNINLSLIGFPEVFKCQK